MTRIKYCFIFLIFSLVFQAHAQKLKYKELYPIIKSDTVTFAVAKQLLTDYIKEEPGFANAYYQYATFCKKHLDELDVLTETNLVIKYCDIAVNHYMLFLSKTSEKDLKNNIEYYPEFTKLNIKNKSDINYNETIEVIKQNISSLQNYQVNIKKISNCFYKSVDNYETAKKIFQDINDRYLCENDIYLLADDNFVNSCKNLISYYDSAAFYINAYAAGISNFPINTYKQKFIFKKIETYRLDGFNAETSFLIDTIIIWDYGYWAKKTNQIIHSEIKDLRLKLEKTEKELSEGIKILQDTSQLFSLPGEYRFNKTTLLKLKKYDFNSVIINLFYFQKHQLDLLILMRSKFKYDTSSVNASSLQLYYGKILQSLYACRMYINEMSATASEKNIRKHQAFINNYFGGNSGFYNYIESNKKDINHVLSEYYQKILGLYLLNITELSGYINYKGNNIPLFASGDNDKSSLYSTSTVKQDKIGNTYLSGYYKKSISDTTTNAFILKLNKNKLIWFKNIESQKSSNYANYINLTDKEVICFNTVINHSDGSLYNNLVKFDLNGKEKYNKKIDYPFPVICFSSDSSGTNHLVVTKTSSGISYLEEMKIAYLNNDGIVSWQNTYKIKGNPKEVLFSGNNFIILGDFSRMYYNNQDYSGIKANSEESSVFILSTDKSGKKTNFYTVKTPEKINLTLITYFDPNNIHIFSLKNKLHFHPKESDGILHIFNNKLQLLFAGI